MSEQISDRAGLPNLIDRVKQLIPAKFRRDAAVVPVVRLSGVIGAVTPLRPGLTLAGIAKTLERAFATRHAKAVALVFVEDVAASGGYMIACAGDEIFCDPSSILGSIGVVGGGFGFQDLIKRIGVERRLHTAGEHKAMLDPFLPEDPDDVRRLKALQREIHAIFIALVKGSRGARLKGSADVLFTGEYWAGEKSVSLGLADKIGDIRSTLRERYGDKVLTPVIAPASGMLSGLLGRRSPGAGALAAFDGIGGLPDDLISALETRAIWARFGF